MTGQAWVWVVLAIIVVLLVGWAINRSRNRSTTVSGSSAPAATPPAAPPSAQAPAPAAAAPVTATPADAAPAAAPPETAPPATVPGSAESNGAAPVAVHAVAEAPPERASDPALAALDSAIPPVAAAVRAPLHPGAALPGPDGSAPSDDYAIKAVEASGRFHDAASPVYSVVRADLYFRDPEAATAAGFVNWQTGRKVAVPVAAAPYAGAVLAAPDGSVPAGYGIKAVDASKRFHDAASPVYSVVRADVYFRDEEAASAAGFRGWNAGRKGTDAAAGTSAPEAPYPGSALPNPDGSAPSAEYVIKAVIGSKRYHDTRSPVYSVLRSDVLFRDPDAAAAAGFAYWKGGSNGPAPDDAPSSPVAPHPGSALPNGDGSAPNGYRIKAVEGSKRYHDPSSPVYAVLRADVLFRDPDAARAAGYRYWRSKR